MPVLSPTSLSTLTEFKKDDIVINSNGVRHSVLFVNNDGTMAVKAHGGTQTKWRVECINYTLQKKKVPVSTWPLPAPAAPKSPPRTPRLKGGLGN